MGALYKPSRWGEIFHNITDQATDCEVCKEPYAAHFCNGVQLKEHLFRGGQIHELLGAGAAGPGKTECLINDANPIILQEHERCLLPPRDPAYHPLGSSIATILFLRRTRPRLEQTIRRAMRVFRTIDPGLRWQADKTTATFSSGLVYQFGHCMNPDDWQQYMGHEFIRIYFDELVEFEEDQYLQISGRVRTTDPLLKRFLGVRACSNPTPHKQNDGVISKDPMWVRARFVDPAPEGKKILYKKMKRANGDEFYRRRLYLPATLYDNPDPDFVQTYEENLMDKPEHIRQALLYGNWYVTVGSFYADYWRDSLHICKPFLIPDDWPRFRSHDWGFKTPGTVIWWAMDPDGNIYAENELTFKLKTVPEVAKLILDYESRHGLVGSDGRSRISGPADTQLWENREGVKTKYEEFSEHGVDWVQADKKSRRRNAELLQQRLADHHQETTPPGLVFFEGCENSIKTIPSIQTDPKELECPADGGADHWHDAVLYACAYASHGREGISYRGWYSDEVEDDGWDDDRGDRGMHGYGSSVC